MAMFSFDSVERMARVTLAVAVAMALYGYASVCLADELCDEAPAVVSIARAPFDPLAPIVIRHKPRPHPKALGIPDAIEAVCMDLEPRFTPIPELELPPAELPPEVMDSVPPIDSGAEPVPFFTPYGYQLIGIGAGYVPKSITPAPELDGSGLTGSLTVLCAALAILRNTSNTGDERGT